MPNVISAVGTAFIGEGSGATTLSVTPTTLGNCLVFSTVISSSSLSTVSVSGGGVTTWTKLGSSFVDSSDSRTFDFWIGAVTTTGAVTITITGSGALTGVTVRFVAQEFSGGGAGTLWTLDNSQTGGLINSASTTVTFPTLTPSGANSCYVGRSWTFNDGLLTGQTSGYTVQLDTGTGPFIYNANVSTVQSPVATQNSPAQPSSTFGALIVASSPPASPPDPPVNRARLTRASCW